LDHDPPVTSDGEVGQHLYDLDDIRKLIANKHLVISVLNAELPISFDSHFDSTTARFLLQHPQCRMRIRDEYGIEHPITEAS
jgi:hypothetical protein